MPGRNAGIFRIAMPTYVYKFIETGETIEVQQSFADDALTEAVHPESGQTMAVKKVFLPVGVTFKGDGFYKTDSRSSKASSKTSSSRDSGSSESGGSESGSSDSGGADSGGSRGSASSSGDSTASKSSSSSSSSSD
jgi:predicted nucleic acid-binding Zn ribbon protein